MRQESNFVPEALSPARAVGLMQLLPETARAVADGAKREHDDAMLTSPAQSIALGALYLKELLDKFHGSIPLAVAAYNAGPDTIARWRTRAPEVDIDVFVDFIPFTETRIYVARVMGNLARYGYLAHGDAGLPKVGVGE
jgi:soluble lytic murein transglycosylase